MITRFKRDFTNVKRALEEKFNRNLPTWLVLIYYIPAALIMLVTMPIWIWYVVWVYFRTKRMFNIFCMEMDKAMSEEIEA